MSGNNHKKIEFAGFSFETNGNILLRGGSETVALEPAAARVLRYFLENEGRLIPKEEILDTVWAEVFTTEDVLKRAVSQIRRALGDDAHNPRFIETYHRRGYRFIGNANFEIANDAPVKALTNKNPDTKPIDPSFDCFVGRKREMNFLQTEFRRVLQGRGQPVLLAGEPGIGKTQTAAKFLEWAQAEEKTVIPLRVRFFDYEASFLPPYNVFLDLLDEACGKIFGATENADLRQTIEEKLGIVLPDELSGNYRNTNQTAIADVSRVIVPLAESFARLSRLRPLVLIFDDVQWANETSRKIIGYLLRIAGDLPLMIVGLTRRGDIKNLSSETAGWLEKQAVYRSFTILELAPLSSENCRDLIVEVFQGQLDANEISPRDLSKLHTATGGNPYFLVETIRLLINENAIEKNQTRWHWRGLEDMPLPETIRMAARAKLVALSDCAREIAEYAAILGDTFQIETLELMIEKSPEDFDKCLDETIAAQVLTEQNVSGTDNCQFYHTTLRRAIYMDLSPRRKKRLHLRALRAIENSHANELEKFSAALAAHAENACEFEIALKLNLQACQAAAARFDWLEAAELLNRAERIAKKIGVEKIGDDEHLRFLSIQGEVYMSIGRRAEAEKILSEAARLAEKISNTADSPLILLNLGRTQILLGKYREAIPVLEKSLELKPETLLASAVKIQIASAKYALCEYEESAEILQKIIDEDDETSYNRAVALGKLGWTRSLQSRYAEGIKLLEEALKFHRTAGDMRERAVLAMCLNSCEYGLGNYEAAIEYAKQARSEAQIVGEPYNESVAMMRVAKSRIAQGLYAEADKLIGEVWNKQKDLEAPHAQAETLWMRGRIRLAQRNFSEAEMDLQTALEMIRTVGDLDDEFRILIDLAHLQNALGNFKQALSLSENAVRITEEIGIAEGIGEALIAQTRALINLEKPEKAVESAREAVRILEEFEAGERWQAHYLLAVALNKMPKKTGQKVCAEIENSFRRSLTILDKMRDQFPDKTGNFYIGFTKSFNCPARCLQDFLKSQNRIAEAADITRSWLLD